MTMEMYHWERKHQGDPPLSVSIVRALPEGNWAVRSEEINLPPQFPTRYDSLRAAMAAADEMAHHYFTHDCSECECGDWAPVPPAHRITRERETTRHAHEPHHQDQLSHAPMTRSVASGVIGALALTAAHELGRRRFANAPRMDQVAMRGLRRLLPGEHPDPTRLHKLALAGDLVANAAYYAVIPASTRRETWIRAVALGTAAGVCALILPQRFGIGAPRNSEKRSNQAMTLAWYLTGAVAAALAATASSPRTEPA